MTECRPNGYRRLIYLYIHDLHLRKAPKVLISRPLAEWKYRNYETFIEK